MSVGTPWDSFEKFERGNRPATDDFVMRGAYVLWLSRKNLSAAVFRSRRLRDDCLGALGPEDPLTQRAEERLSHYGEAVSRGSQVQHGKDFAHADRPHHSEGSVRNFV